jgi:N-acetylglucosamine kinase-like BadF-type ATPase
MSAQPIAVGVDAGATSTDVAVSRAGAFEHIVRGGPGNPTTRGVEAVVTMTAETILRATGGDEPAALYVGAAGAGREKIAQRLERALRLAFPNTKHLAVAGDVESALRAAIPAGPGVVVIAGTGSVAYAENGERRARAGGFGYLIGDEGSAHAIGFAALKLLARVYDGRARADETSALVERALGCSDRDTLIATVYERPLDVPKIAALAPSIVAFAGKGNRASTKIVQTAAQELGDLVRFAAQQTGLAEGSPAIALAGGLLRENSLLSSLLETRIINELPGASIVRLREEPARAALRFAEAMLG